MGGIHRRYSGFKPCILFLLLLLCDQITYNIAAENDSSKFLAEDETEILARRLAMSPGSVGVVTLANTYIVGEGSPVADTVCDASYCDTSAVHAGGSFVVQLPDLDGVEDFSTSDTISLEEVSQGGCGARINPVGKTSTGQSIITKFASISSTTNELDPGLPVRGPNNLSTPGRVPCYKKTLGDLETCFIGCEDDDCGATDNIDQQGITVTKPGFYNLCTCLDGNSGAVCANGSASDFSVDLGVVVQVLGFSQKSYMEDNMCSADIKKCVFGYPCKLEFNSSGYDGINGNDLTDINTVLGVRYDPLDPLVTEGHDAIAIMEQSGACTGLGTILTHGGGSKFVSMATHNADSLVDADVGEIVEFDFGAVGNIDIAPGEYRTCYCPGAAYGSEVVGGLDCSTANPGLYPFKAGKLTVRGPDTDTLGSNTCHIGQECTIYLSEQNAKCHEGNDTIAIVGNGVDTSFVCGDASIDIQGLTTTAALNGVTLQNPSNGTVEGNFMWDLQAGSGIQGDYNLCWCPNSHTNCYDPLAISDDFKVTVGTLTIPGAKASTPKPCYTGRECTLRFPSSVLNKDCFGCQAGDRIAMIESKPSSFNLNNLEFFDRITGHCGSNNATHVSYSTSSNQALDYDVTDTDMRFNYTFPSVEFKPPTDGTTNVHSLCWAAVTAPESFNTFVTLNSDFTVYGPHPDNFVTCSANATDCAAISLGIHRHATLMIGDDEDSIVAQPASEDCGMGSMSYFEVSEASNMYSVTNQMTDGTAPTPPGEYKLCYCPKTMMVDSGLAEEATPNLCDTLADFTSEVGRFIIAGPADAMAPGGSGTYKVHKDVPFDLTLYGYELGENHKVKFVNATQDCLLDTFNDTIDNYVADGSSPSYLTSQAVLDSIVMTSAEGISETEAVLGVNDTTLLYAGAQIKFISSMGSVQGVNTHTRHEDTLFRTRQLNNGFPRDDWTYEVTEVINQTHFNIEYPNMPVITTLGTHTFQLATKEVYSSLIASEPDSLKLCWAGNGMEFFEAGTLEVLEPAKIPMAHIYLTTKEVSQNGPSILTFTTGSSEMVNHLHKTDGSESIKSIYEDPQRSLKLRIRFPDTAKFKPLTAALGSSTSLTTDVSIDSEAEASAAACSKLFFEMYSAEGFPVPEKCWYQKNGTGKTVDIYMQFSVGNGLKPSTEYQLVMNTMITASAGSVTDADIQAHITILDDYKMYPGTAVEQGMLTYVNNGFNLTSNNAGTGRHLSSTAAIEITSEDAVDGLLDVTDPTDKTIKLSITAGATKPLVGDYIEIFMYPLTMWDLKSTDVSFNSLTGFGTTSNATITTGAVIPGGLQNVLIVQMNDNMTATPHEIELSAGALHISDNGFFPLVPAYTSQLLTEGSKTLTVDTGPVDFANSIYLYREPKITTANVVTITDTVNNKNPFKSETNILHLRFILGTSIFFDGTSGSTAITVTLPKGAEASWSSTCVAHSSASSTDLSVIQYSDEMNSIPRMAPTGHGILLGSFTASDNVCTLKLDSGVMIPAHASVYVAIKVQNPTVGVKSSNPENAFSLGITQGKGRFSAQVSDHTVTAKLMPDIMDKRYGANVAILGYLPSESFFVAPLTTQKAESSTYMSVFFKTEQSFTGTLELTAPDGFLFRDLNGQGLIPSSIMPAEPDNRDITLPSINSVFVGKSGPDSSTDNFVSISFSGPLEADQSYGFKIGVRTPAKSPPNSHWNIKTFENVCSYQSATGTSRFGCYPIDSLIPNGTPEVEPFVYDKDGAYFDFHIVDSLYNNGAPTKVLFKFQLESELEVGESVYIDLPQGYDFVSPAVQTDIVSAYSEDPKHSSFIDRERQAQTWTAAGVTTSGNKISFRDDATLFNATSSTSVYYLEANIAVPINTVTFSDTPSPNVALFHTGKMEPTEMTSSSIVYPAHYVSQIENGGVDSTSLVAGDETEMHLRFQTFSVVQDEGCVRIGFPFSSMKYETSDNTACMIHSIPDEFYSATSNSAECAFEMDSSSDPAYIKAIEIKSSDWLGPGKYHMKLPNVINPPAAYKPSPMDVFTIESYANCSDSFTDRLNILDAKTTIDATIITSELNYASIVELPEQSSTRPGIKTTYGLGFALSSAVILTDTISVKAPEGYAFSSDCTNDVSLDIPVGSGENATMWMDHTPLADNATMSACTGNKNFATIELSSFSDLLSETKYLFSINLMNPRTSMPKPNTWTILVSDEAKTVEGTYLSFFDDIFLSGTSPAKNADSSIVISFVPSTDIGGIGSSISVHFPGDYDDSETIHASIADIDANQVMIANYYEGELGAFRNATDLSALSVISTKSSSGLTVTFAIGSESVVYKAGTSMEVSYRVKNPGVVSYADPGQALIWSCDPTSEQKVCSVDGYQNYQLAVESLDVGFANMYPIVDPLVVEPNPLVPENNEGMIETSFTMLVKLAGIGRVVGDWLVVVPPSAYDICSSIQTSVYNEDYLTQAECTGDGTAIFTTQMHPETNSTVIPAELSFTFSTMNPSTPVPIEENTWLVKYVEGTGAIEDALKVEAKATAYVAGWKMLTKLDNVLVDLAAGSSAGTGEYSSIKVSFNPMQSANQVTIESHSGFDMSFVTIDEGDIIEKSVSSVTIGMNISSGQSVSFILKNVMNPSVAKMEGTYWTISTGNGGDTYLDTAAQVKGHSIMYPLNIAVAGTDVANQYLSQDKWWMDIDVVISANIFAGDTISVEEPNGFVVSNIYADENRSSSSGSSYEFATDHVANLVIPFTIECSTPSETPDWNQVWKFVVSQQGSPTMGGTIPMIEVGVFPAKMGLVMEASSKVPGAQTVSYSLMITLTLPLTVSDSPELHIEAPKGYTYGTTSDTCLPDSSEEESGMFGACSVNENKVTYSNLSVDLESESTVTINLTVNHPKTLPESLLWHIYVFDANMSVPQAIHDKGASVELLSAVVAYQPLADQTTDLVIMLTPTVTIEGGMLAIMTPSDFTLSLPDGSGMVVFDDATNTIKNMTVAANTDYSIHLMVSIPSSSSDDMPLWGLALKDGNLEVLEANHNIAAPGVNENSDKFGVMTVEFDSNSLLKVKFTVSSIVSAPSSEGFLVEVALTGGFEVGDTCSPSVNDALTLTNSLCDSEYNIASFAISNQELTTDTSYELSLSITKPSSPQGFNFVQVGFVNLDPPVYSGIVYDAEKLSDSTLTTTQAPTENSCFTPAIPLSLLLVLVTTYLVI